jgi:hypothetical protein
MTPRPALPLPFDPTSRWVRAAALLLAVALLTGGIVQVRSQVESRREAAVAEARYAFQQQLNLSYDGMAEPAREATVALSGVREILQQHLALTGRTGEELAVERDQRLAEIRDLARRLREASTATPPIVPEELAPVPPASLGEQLSSLKDEADALATQLDDVAESVETWTSALAHLRRGALTFVAAAESHEATTDPTTLADQWRSERASLEAYRAAVDRAADVPGLVPVVAAHRAYIDANLAWIDEAVALLEQAELDAYNARLREVFGVPDPFGFSATLQAALEESFDLGVLAELAVTRDAATAFLDRLAEAARLAPILLRPSDAEGGPADPPPAAAPDDPLEAAART